MTELHKYTRCVFPQLDLHAFQRLIVLYLLVEYAIEPGKPATIPLVRFCEFVNGSESTVREHLRSLRAKGVLSLDPTRAGFVVVLQPAELIPGVVLMRADPVSDPIEINYFNRALLPDLLSRQGGKCAYSLRLISPDQAEIDHIHPQARGGDNSFRNVVACSFEMNKKKGSREVNVFLRELYRDGLLSYEEFEERLHFIVAVVSGELIPG